MERRQAALRAKARTVRMRAEQAAHVRPQQGNICTLALRVPLPLLCVSAHTESWPSARQQTPHEGADDTCTVSLAAKPWLPLSPVSSHSRLTGQAVT